MIITKEDIVELSRSNSMLSMVVYQYHIGCCTWEESMMLAVSELIKENEKLKNIAIKCIDEKVYKV